MFIEKLMSGFWVERFRTNFLGFARRHSVSIAGPLSRKRKNEQGAEFDLNLQFLRFL
jgi:hypothetical protein